MTCKCCGKDVCLNGPKNPELEFTQLSGVNSRGEITISGISQLEQNFRSTIVGDAQNNVLAKTKKNFPNFFTALNDLNSDFLQRGYVRDIIGNYEVVEYRLTKGYIGELEFAEFLDYFNHTPTSISNVYNTNANKIVFELNEYYTGSASGSVMGSFCKLMPNVFGAIDSFFDILDDVNAAITSALEFISKIRNVQNPLQAIFDGIKITALIEAIKEKVKKSFQKMVKKIQSAIENFSLDNVMGQVETFVNEKIVGKFNKMKSDVMAFFDENNIKKLEKKFENLIDYAMGLFENPSLDEVQLLIQRICGLMAGVEGLVQGLKDPLDDFANRYEEVFNTLKHAGDRVKGEAIRAGAIRLDDDERKERINKARGIWEREGNFKKPDASEFEKLPSWDAIKDNNNSVFHISDFMKALGRTSYDEVDPTLKVMLMRLQKRAKVGPIIIERGWNSQQIQKSMSNEPEDNMHTSGMAIDIKWSGLDPQSDEYENVKYRAFKIGFRDIGLYDHMIHLGTGPEQTWDVRTKVEESEKTTAPSTFEPPATDPKTAEQESDYEWLYPGADEAADEQLLQDVYDGKYNDGDIVDYQGGKARIVQYSEETEDFEAGYDIVPLSSA